MDAKRAKNKAARERRLERKEVKKNALADPEITEAKESEE